MFLEGTQGWKKIDRGEGFYNSDLNDIYILQTFVPHPYKVQESWDILDGWCCEKKIKPARVAMHH